MPGIKLVLAILLFCLDNNCLFSQLKGADYPYNVGSIAFDSLTDNPAFEILDEKSVLPYNTLYGMLIEGERYAVLEYFAEKYRSKPTKGQTGFIVVRFMVNHKGETDRFRKYEMDKECQPFKFDSSISDTIFNLTKKLSGWQVLTEISSDSTLFNYTRKISGRQILAEGSVAKPEKSEKKYDYYQYLVFKMKDGLIEHILP